MSEFIEYIKMSTGQEYADIQNWKLTECVDLVGEFVKKKQDEFLESITLKKKEDEIFLLPVIDAETLSPKQ